MSASWSEGWREQCVGYPKEAPWATLNPVPREKDSQIWLLEVASASGRGKGEGEEKEEVTF